MSARSSFSLKTCLLKKMKRHIKKNNPKLHSRKSDFRKKNEKHANTKNRKKCNGKCKERLVFFCSLFAFFLHGFDLFPLFLHFFRKKHNKKNTALFCCLLFCVFSNCFFCICFFVCFCFLCFPIACVLHLLGDPVLHLLFSNSSFFAVCLLFFSSAFFLRIILSG